MKYFKIILIFATVIYAKNSNNSNLILSEDNFISSGVYHTNASIDRLKYKSTTIKGKYRFYKDKTVNPFVIGGFSYSRQYSNNSNDTLKALKLGGGLNYKLNNNIDLTTQYISTLSFSSLKNLTVDKQLNSYSTSLNYHTKLKSINPYFNSKVTFNKLKDIDGFSINLEGGVVSNKITNIYSYPIYTKAYLGLSAYDKTLSKVVKFNRAYSAGVELYWKIGKILKYKKLDNLSIAIKAQKSLGNNNFNGEKVGVGLKLLKF